jgi:hypothetical protein
MKLCNALFILQIPAIKGQKRPMMILRGREEKSDCLFVLSGRGRQAAMPIAPGRFIDMIRALYVSILPRALESVIPWIWSEISVISVWIGFVVLSKKSVGLIYFFKLFFF